MAKEESKKWKNIQLSETAMKQLRISGAEKGLELKPFIEKVLEDLAIKDEKRREFKTKQK